MTSTFAVAQDTGALIAAITALVTALVTGLVSVLNWAQRMRESGAKSQAEEAKQASIAQQAALDGLRETYRQGLEQLNNIITNQQTQITAQATLITNQQGDIGQLKGALAACDTERHALVEDNKTLTARVTELERKSA